MANGEMERILRISIKEMHTSRLEELQWRAVHEDGSPFPVDDYLFQLVLRSGKPVKDLVIGLLQDYEKGCRWFKVSALPRFKAGSAELFQVVSTFIEISAPLHGTKST